MLLLLNNVVIPIGCAFDGVYTKRTITVDEFKRLILIHKNDIKSYIQYQYIADVLCEITGVKVELCRSRWDIRLGDTALCMQLRYRILQEDKEDRIHGSLPEDYDYSIFRFEKCIDYCENYRCTNIDKIDKG